MHFYNDAYGGGFSTDSFCYYMYRFSVERGTIAKDLLRNDPLFVRRKTSLATFGEIQCGTTTMTIYKGRRGETLEVVRNNYYGQPQEANQETMKRR